VSGITVRTSPQLRVASGIATVLAIAVVGFVIRGAWSGAGKDPSGVAARPTQVAPGPQRFRLRAAGHNVIPKGASTIATARKRTVRVYARAKGKRSRRLRARVFNGQRIPLTFLVVGRRKGWVRVSLPTRPNQSRGWLRRKAVDLSFTRLRIEVRRKARRLRLLEGKRVVSSTRIALGKSLSPTPPGRYYVTDVIKAKNPKGFYGPYALGLSAHSTVYTSFAGGSGQVGIHGTNQPSVLGKSVSHGCIRVRNDIIRRLARRVPLGTPVLIRG
jgi:lipoprotein-anchoring transpeptidase ErfK/SrfK